MNIWLRVGFVIVILCTLFGTALSFRYGYKSGETEVDRLAMGALLAFMDVTKVMLPLILLAFGALWHWGAHLGVWVVVLGLSLISGLGTFGFFAGNRADFLSDLKHFSAVYDDTASEKQRKIKQRDNLPKHRLYGVVRAQYDAKRCHLKNRKKWRSCRRLMKEMGAAIEAKRLDAEIATLKSDFGKKEAKSEDMQLKMLALITNGKVENILIYFSLFMSAMLEVIGLVVPTVMLNASRSLKGVEEEIVVSSDAQLGVMTPSVFDSAEAAAQLRLVSAHHWSDRFVKDACLVDASEVTPAGKLYQQYQWWMQNVEREAALSYSEFIDVIVPVLERTQGVSVIRAGQTFIFQSLDLVDVADFKKVV